ncbi:hypothetical protein LINPERPRIM_LOCUS7897 [Linum perenne]
MFESISWSSYHYEMQVRPASYHLNGGTCGCISQLSSSMKSSVAETKLM